MSKNPYRVKCQVCRKWFNRPNRNNFRCGVCRGTTYPLKFKKLREKIIPKSKCTICGMTNSKSKKLFGVSLHLHHIDGNRKNNSLNNLMVKCVQCHLGEHKSGKAVAIRLGSFGNRRIYSTI